MNRRLAWMIGGIAAAVVIAGTAIWLFQASTAGDVPGASPTATAEPTPAADPLVLAQQQLDDHLEGCTEDIDGGAVPEGCGIRIPWGTEFATIDSIRFRIEQLPVLDLVDDGFTADGGILVATVSGTGQDGAPRTETYRTDSWSLRGDVSITGDDVDLDVW